MTEPPPSGSGAVGLQARVQRIIGVAEQAAIDLQRAVEQEAARRAVAVHQAAQDDADRIRAEAEAQAQAYLEDMRRRIDAFAGARVDRISELTDGLLARGEAIQACLADAVDLEGQLRDLLTAAGAAARAAAAEGARPTIRLPQVLEEARVEHASPAAGGPSERSSAPGGPGAGADAGVQRIAQDPPRAPRPPSPTEDQPA